MNYNIKYKMNFYKRAFVLAKLQKSSFSRCMTLYQVPVRFVHPRGYNDFFDSYTNIFHETNFALMGAKETEQFAYVLDRFSNTMTDTQLAYMF